MSKTNRIAVTSVLALLAVIAFPPGAHAAGELTSVGCIRDVNGPLNTCVQEVDMMRTPFSVAVSPDGKSVYVAGRDSDSISLFTRNTVSGALTPAGCFQDNDESGLCAVQVNGLDGAAGVAVSPDGKSVYAVSRNDDAIVRFNRATNGALTSAGCVDDNDTGADVCALSVNGLDGAGAVVVSPDGKSVYAASRDNDNAVVRFNRSTTGALTSGGCVDDNDFGDDVCALAVNGLGRPFSLAVSPDGVSLYVAGAQDDAIVRFNRSTTGALTSGGCVDDNDTGADVCALSVNGLENVSSVVVSSDGKSVYAAAPHDDAIVRFNRSTTGALTSAGCVNDNDIVDDVCALSVNGLGGVSGVATSPDGKSVYGTALGDSAVTRFNRSTTGALTSGGCVADVDTAAETCAQSADGLWGAAALTVSPDGKSVYTVSVQDWSLAHFNRQL